MLQVLNGLQAIPRWQAYFDRPTGTTLGLIGSMYALGAIVSVPFVPYLADTFGRRRSVQLGCVIMIVGAALQTAAHERGLFMAARAIIGIGITPGRYFDNSPSINVLTKVQPSSELPI